MNIEDLKCCGNCLYRRSMSSVDHVKDYCVLGFIIKSFKCCSEWRYDMMSAEDRKWQKGDC